MSGLVHVLTPVYNDSQALGRLLEDLNAAGEARGLVFSVIVVDDGSRQPVEVGRAGAYGHIADVRVLRLYSNMGHQQAIAVGLAYAAEEVRPERLVVMDADGEDRPKDIPALLEAIGGGGPPAAVARRTRRREGMTFRLFYALFKAVYRLLTGQGLPFGNFAALRGPEVEYLASMPGLWSNFPATLLRSKIQMTKVPTERGRRYCGSSKMNFLGLVLHGLSAISVFADVALGRVLLGSGGVALASLSAMLAVLGIRVFTDLAIPGWASTMVLSLAILCVQSGLFVTSLIFILLSGKGQGQLIPRKVYGDYIVRRERLEMKA